MIVKQYLKTATRRISKQLSQFVNNTYPWMIMKIMKKISILLIGVGFVLCCLLLTTCELEPHVTMIVDKEETDYFNLISNPGTAREAKLTDDPKLREGYVLQWDAIEGAEQYVFELYYQEEPELIVEWNNVKGTKEYTFALIETPEPSSEEQIAPTTFIDTLTTDTSDETASSGSSEVTTQTNTQIRRFQITLPRLQPPAKYQLRIEARNSFQRVEFEKDINIAPAQPILYEVKTSYDKVSRDGTEVIPEDFSQTSKIKVSWIQLEEDPEYPLIYYVCYTTDPSPSAISKQLNYDRAGINLDTLDPNEEIPLTDEYGNLLYLDEEGNQVFDEDTGQPILYHELEEILPDEVYHIAVYAKMEIEAIEDEIVPTPNSSTSTTTASATSSTTTPEKNVITLESALSDHRSFQTTSIKGMLKYSSNLVQLGKYVIEIAQEEPDFENDPYFLGLAVIELSGFFKLVLGRDITEDDTENTSYYLKPYKDFHNNGIRNTESCSKEPSTVEEYDPYLSEITNYDYAEGDLTNGYFKIDWQAYDEANQPTINFILSNPYEHLHITIPDTVSRTICDPPDEYAYEFDLEISNQWTRVYNDTLTADAYRQYTLYQNPISVTLDFESPDSTILKPVPPSIVYYYLKKEGDVDAEKKRVEIEMADSESTLELICRDRVLAPDQDYSIELTSGGC